MQLPNQIVNHDGETWNVQHNESPLLTTFGGYLMMYENLSLITLSTHLSSSDQAHGRMILLQHLASTPTGTAQTITWSPDDE